MVNNCKIKLVVGLINRVIVRIKIIKNSSMDQDRKIKK